MKHITIVTPETSPLLKWMKDEGVKPTLEWDPDDYVKICEVTGCPHPPTHLAILGKPGGPQKLIAVCEKHSRCTSFTEIIIDRDKAEV